MSTQPSLPFFGGENAKDLDSEHLLPGCLRAADIVSGRYYALQMGMAHAGPLFSGSQYSETWTEHNSHTSVEWSLIGLVLRPA